MKNSEVKDILYRVKKPYGFIPNIRDIWAWQKANISPSKRHTEYYKGNVFLSDKTDVDKFIAQFPAWSVETMTREVFYGTKRKEHG